MTGRNRPTSSYSNDAAHLPALPTVRVSDPAVQRFFDAVREWLEVRAGARGDKFERAVTMRDLAQLGLIDTATYSGPYGRTSGVPSSQSNGGVMIQTASGYTTVDFEVFAKTILDSKLFRSLAKSLNDPTRFDDLPQRVRDVLLRDITSEAAQRGADIRHLEQKIQTAQESFAMTVDEVTAGLGTSLAGVRETSYAAATMANAIAGKVTQVEARLDVPVDPADIDATVHASLAALQTAVPVGAFGVYYQVDDPASTDNFLYRWDGTQYVLAGQGISAKVEEMLLAEADLIDGARAQYTVKVQAGNRIAGFGLASTDPVAGAGTSAFIVMADKFAIVSVADSIADPTAPPLSRIPFGIDTTNDTIYINGNVRINTGGGTGPRLDSLSSGQSVAVVYAYKRSATDLVAGWDAATNGPGACTYDFNTKAFTAALSNGWTAAIPGGTDPLYVTAVTAAATGATDAIAATEWATCVKLVENGSAGLKTAVVELFQRTATSTPPTTPAVSDITYDFTTHAIAGTLGSWSTTIPSSGGAYLWVTRATAASLSNTDTLLSSEWATAAQLALDGADGGDGEGVIVEYSVDGATAWHSTFTTGDIFARWKIGTGGTWSDVFKIVGEDGSAGDYVDFIFKRANTQPATPTGASPAGWSDAPPAADGSPLWASTAQKTAAGALVGAWSTPVQIEGNPGVGIQCVATAQAFAINQSGTATPSTIIVSVTRPGALSVPAVNADFTWTVTSGTFTGSLTTINSSTGAFPAFGQADMTTDAVTFRCEYQPTSGLYSGQEFVDYITVIKVREGVTVSGFLTNESHTVPADNAGTVSSWSGCSGNFKVYSGTSEVTGSCTYSVVSYTGWATSPSAPTAGTGAYSFSGSPAMSADVATVTYRASYTHPTKGAVTLDKTFTVAKAKQGTTGSTGGTGAPGARGSLNLYISGTSPLTSTECDNAVVAATGSSTKILGDVVTEGNGSTYVSTLRWNGSSWVPPGVVIDGSLLVTGSVTAAAIAANTITADKLSATSIDGKTITGSTIRTASSGARIELSHTGNYIAGFDSGGTSRFAFDADTGLFNVNGTAPALWLADFANVGGGEALRVSNTSTGTALRAINSGSGYSLHTGARVRMDLTTETGAGTATFSGTKPGVSNTNVWVPVTLADGNEYLLPVWKRNA